MYQHTPLPHRLDSKIVIVGHQKDTQNYENALASMGVRYLTTMDLGRFQEFDALLLPGGGDITPVFFGEKNHGSKNIDIELDITQLQALDLFVRWKRPVLGICKGLQIINVFFGGTIIQDLSQKEVHQWDNQDKIHSTIAHPGSFLSSLYGTQFSVNSAHHQGVGILGHDLSVIQTSTDNVIEGVTHNTLPIIGVQWHPERLFYPAEDSNIADGQILFSYFLSMCSFAGV